MVERLICNQQVIGSNPVPGSRLEGMPGRQGCLKRSCRPANGAKSSVTRPSPNTLASMLTAEERVILDFERASLVEGGPKDQIIEFRLGITSADYYRRLLQIMDKPSALVDDPLTIRRLRGLVEQRTNPNQKGVAG